MEPFGLSNLRKHYRSDTHWYIQHDAGRLTIKIDKAYPQTQEYVPDAVGYFKGSSLSDKVVLNIANENEFTAEAAKGSAIYYDIGDLEVRWVLPDGTLVEGVEVDADVEAGTTLCMCKSFYCTKISVDCTICHLDLRDMPRTVTSKVIPGSMALSNLADYEPASPHWGPNRAFRRKLGFSVQNSDIVGNTKDITKFIDRNNFLRLQVNYCPNITGDLAELDIHIMQSFNHWGTGNATSPRGFANFYDDKTVNLGNMLPIHVSFHHCGVHGYPRLKSHWILYWEYYACPNATPEDYDNLIEQIIVNADQRNYYTQSVNGVGFCVSNFEFYNEDDPIVEEYRAAGAHIVPMPSLGSDPTEVIVGPLAKIVPNGTNSIIPYYSIGPNTPLVPAYGSLKISNRTADPEHRALRLDQLRTAGWTVEEVDDSLEEGIYAARDV